MRYSGVNIYISSRQSPYSPQTNPIELCFAQAKRAFQMIFECNEEFSRVVTEINIEGIEKEYDRRFQTLVNLYQGNEVGENPFNEDFMVIDSNQVMFQRGLEDLERWRTENIERATVDQRNVNPTRDTISNELFVSLIHYAFKKITKENGYHYLGRTIKVAHSCLHGYPLVMNDKFYKDYLIEDDRDLRRIADELIGSN